jgi:SAM-dependent methyltransferase
MFPDSDITGIDLVPEHVATARDRARHYDLRRARFLVSPSEHSLPDGLSPFDYVFLNGVYEHLLPRERAALLPMLWSCVRPGGILFLTSPYRYFFIEQHTTGIPFLNYCPDSLALRLARRFSKKIQPHESWESLLRRGIRGATEQEFLRLLPRGAGKATLLEPNLPGVRDRIDLWFAASGPSRRGFKRVLRMGMKAWKALSGRTMVPFLHVAIRKDRTPSKP